MGNMQWIYTRELKDRNYKQHSEKKIVICRSIFLVNYYHSVWTIRSHMLQLLFNLTSDNVLCSKTSIEQEIFD